MCNFLIYSTQAGYSLHDRTKKNTKKLQIFVEYLAKISGLSTFYHLQAIKTAKITHFVAYSTKRSCLSLTGKKKQKKEKQKQEKYVIL